MSLLNLIRSLVGGKRSTKSGPVEASLTISAESGTTKDSKRGVSNRRNKQRRSSQAEPVATRPAETNLDPPPKPRRTSPKIPRTPFTKCLRKHLKNATMEDFLVAQIGIDDGSVASEASVFLADATSVKVVIIDPFDGGEANRNLMSLHRSFRASGVNGQIMPGEVQASLEKATRDMGAVDLLVVLRKELLNAANAETASRLVHPETLVIERGENVYEVVDMPVAGHRAVRSPVRNEAA